MELSQEQLYDVTEIAASSRAFAALRADGRVVAWGHPHCGGDCRRVQEELHGVPRFFHCFCFMYMKAVLNGQDYVLLYRFGEYLGNHK